MTKKQIAFDLFCITIAIVSILSTFRKPKNPDGYVTVPESRYMLVVGSESYAAIDNQQVSIEAIQERTGLTGEDIDGKVGTKTVKAVMRANRGY